MKPQIFQRIPNRQLPEYAKILAFHKGDVIAADSTLAYLVRCEHYASESFHVALDRDHGQIRGADDMQGGRTTLDIWHLSIKRHDRRAVHDWRKLQAIKSQLLGDEYEAVELYPAESRVVDTANQYHLFVLVYPDGSPFHWPFGFNDGRVILGPGEGTPEILALAPNAVQRAIK